MEKCQVGCTEHEHYGARLRAKGIQVPPAATPTRTRKHTYRPPAQPSWEAGIAGEHRPDGSFMPYLNADREEMGVKEYAENRHNVQAQVDRLKSDPNVFREERETSAQGG